MIKDKFSNRTVLTIAHRLHTIIDCNRVLVLENGHNAEFDTPANLLQKQVVKISIFYLYLISLSNIYI